METNNMTNKQNFTKPNNRGVYNAESTNPHR